MFNNQNNMKLVDQVTFKDADKSSHSHSGRHSSE